MAAALWCFSPYILGHAAVIAPDAHAAAMGVAALYAYWLWLRQPHWRRVIAAGVVLGLAELTKFTLLVIYPLLPIMWLVCRLVPTKGIRSVAWLHEIGMVCLLIVISVVVINLGYTFEGSFQQLDRFQFHASMLTGAYSGRSNAPRRWQSVRSFVARGVSSPLAEKLCSGTGCTDV